ncbi:hypothetical protein ACOMHN_039087 [Nucella lapillus]
MGGGESLGLVVVEKDLHHTSLRLSIKERLAGCFLTPPMECKEWRLNLGSVLRSLRGDEDPKEEFSLLAIALLAFCSLGLLLPDSASFPCTTSSFS